MRNRMAHLALSVMAVIGLGTGTALAVKCTAKVATAISVIDPAVFSKLHDANRDLASEQLDRYEYISGRHFDNFCHSDTAQGWVRDATVRDTSTFTSMFIDGA